MSADLYDLGPDFSGGPEGVDRSLLAHCLALAATSKWNPYLTQPVAVEFGTGTGETTRMIAEVLPVISFDSFEGLPEDWRPNFPAGRFGDLTMPTDIPGATIVPGWFKDTVVGYDWPDSIALVHMDCDLYSSTKTALDSIGPYIEPGCIIVFDEFHGFSDDLMGEVPGEQQAWREFVGKSGLVWEVIGHGREQWALRIK
jgi:hypothetical protein